MVSSRPELSKQIETIAVAIEQLPELKDTLLFHKTLLESISLLGSGTIIFDADTIRNLETLAIAGRKPIHYFIAESTLLNSISFPDVYKSLVFSLSSVVKDELTQEKLKKLEYKLNEINIEMVLREFFRGNNDEIERVADNKNIDRTILTSTIKVLARAFSEHLARAVSDDFQNKWFEKERTCPVCGNIFNISRIKAGSNARYLVCSFCGLETISDEFYCPKCGNTDPYQLMFRTFEELPQFSMNICKKCGHYLKVINENKCGFVVPAGLEDILTAPMDVLYH